MGLGWKLLVEGLGKIERAEVEGHPLMLFVGDNNSGKSYLATVLWGLFSQSGLFQIKQDGEVINACESWLAERLARCSEQSSYVLSSVEHDTFLRLFNEMLDLSKDKFIEYIFNAEGVRASQISVGRTDAAALPTLQFLISPDENAADWAYDVDGADIKITFSKRARTVDLAHRMWKELSQLLSADMSIGKSARAQYTIARAQDPRILNHSQANPLFLPASRTGFMLFNKTAVSSQLEQLIKGEHSSAPRLDLTTPAVYFLRWLTVGAQPMVGPYAEEAAFLEEALHGRLELVPGVGVKDYFYRPTGSDSRLNMTLSSSLVTELAPIILVLRHMPRFPVLILEEPEAHLHPKMHRRLAQTIVRLIRKGLYVWITTHSENFCQQINNFLKIGCSLKRAELQKHFGYAEQDYLTLEDVSGYQFTLEGDKSKVSELKKKTSGLVMPTFNREIAALSKETLYLQEQTVGEG